MLKYVQNLHILSPAVTQMTQHIFEMLGNSCSIHTKKLNHNFLSAPKSFISDDYLHLTILFWKIV